jgi:hypothetical protein
MRRLLGALAVAWFCSFLLAPATSSAEALLQRRGTENEPRTVIGHVMNRQDQPVQKAIVYLKNTKTLAIKTYISEADGSYRFSGLTSNVDFEIYAEHEGARSDTKTVSSFDSRKQVNITLRIK